MEVRHVGKGLEGIVRLHIHLVLPPERDHQSISSKGLLRHSAPARREVGSADYVEFFAVIPAWSTVGITIEHDSVGIKNAERRADDSDVEDDVLSRPRTDKVGQRVVTNEGVIAVRDRLPGSSNRNGDRAADARSAARTDRSVDVDGAWSDGRRQVRLAVLEIYAEDHLELRFHEGWRAQVDAIRRTVVDALDVERVGRRGACGDDKCEECRDEPQADSVPILASGCPLISEMLRCLEGSVFCRYV